jgi:hypothetical protein
MIRRHPPHLALAIWLGVSLGSGVLLASGDAGGDRFKGLRLSAALEKLHANGLKILFSSDLVRPEMVVVKEPRGRWPQEILDELLAPHGLKSIRGPAGALLIVKAPPTALARRTTAPARAGPPSSATPTPPPSSARAPHSYRDHVIVNGADPAQRQREPAMRALVPGERLQTSPEPVGDALLPAGRLPGVATIDGAGGLHVRGGSSRETKIILDGLELYEPYHLKDRGGPISLIDAHAIGGMSLLGGAFPAEYGGYVGAVLEMDTIVPSDDLHSEVAIGSDGLHLASQGLVRNRLRWIVAGRRGHAAPLLDALGADRTYRPAYWDVFAKADYHVDDRTTVSLHLLNGDDELEGANTDETIVTVREPGTFKSRHTNRYAWLTLRRATPRLLSQTVISSTLVTNDRFGSSPRVVEVNDSRSLAILGLKQDWWWQSPRHLVKWGLEATRVEAVYAYQARPAIGSSMAIAQSPRGREVGVYVADQWRVSPRLDVEIGLRWDRHTYTPQGRGTPGPRLNAVYALSPRTAVRVGWGLFSQPQKINELQVEDGVDRFVPAERAEHRLVSVDQDLTGGLRAEVHAYQKRVRDVSPRFENLFDPFGFFPEAAHDRVRVAADVARAEGLELVVRRPTRVSAAASEGRGRLWPTGWQVAYSLARVEDRVDGRWVPRSWDQRHALNAGVDWMPGPGWDLALAATVHSGRPTTPVIGTLVAGLDGSWTIAPIFGPRNSERLPAYARADLRVSRSIRIRGSDLRGTLTVTDLFNRGTSCCVADVSLLPQPDGTVAVTRHLRDGLPRLVTFGMSWRF